MNVWRWTNSRNRARRCCKPLCRQKLIPTTCKPQKRNGFAEVWIRHRSPITNICIRFLNKLRRSGRRRKLCARLFRNRALSQMRFRLIYRIATNHSNQRKSGGANGENWVSLTGLVQFDNKRAKDFQPPDEKPLTRFNRNRSVGDDGGRCGGGKYQRIVLHASKATYEEIYWIFRTRIRHDRRK